MIVDKILACVLLLILGSCSFAIVGSAAHCVYTGNKAECPGIYKRGKCITATLGCPE